MELEAIQRNTILRGIIGSRAYGTANADSDTDVRCVFQRPTMELLGLHQPRDNYELHPSPTDEGDAIDLVYWELGKFLNMCLACNPTVMELLWTPFVEYATATGAELIGMRSAFLSQRAIDSYGGYARQQLRHFENAYARFKNYDEEIPAVAWKHAAHAGRLLIAGSIVCLFGRVELRLTEPQVEKFLRVRRGEEHPQLVLTWLFGLLDRFNICATHNKLPERADVERIETFLLRCRKNSWD